MNDFIRNSCRAVAFFLLYKYRSDLTWEFTIYLGVFVVIIELFMRYKK